MRFFWQSTLSSPQNGLDIARAIRRTNQDAVILFLTNFIEYAPEGYEVQAFRYLLKRDMDLVLEGYLMEALAQLADRRERLRLSLNGGIVELDLKDILYLEVLQHHVSIHVLSPDAPSRGRSRCSDGAMMPSADRSPSDTGTIQTYTLTASLASFEQTLTRHGFSRVHKSYRVNMSHIQRFQCKGLVPTGHHDPTVAQAADVVLQMKDGRWLF